MQHTDANNVGAVFGAFGAAPPRPGGGPLFGAFGAGDGLFGGGAAPPPTTKEGASSKTKPTSHQVPLRWRRCKGWTSTQEWAITP